MEAKKHIYYFDYLRIFAAVCVIFMHVASDPLRMAVEEIGAGWHCLNLATSLAFTAVPLFFMISGYLLMTSKNTPDIHVLLHKRLPRLAVPLGAFSLVAVLWLNRSAGIRSVVAALAQAVSSPAMLHLWFMYTLIALYLISPILYGGLQALKPSGRRYCIILLCVVVFFTTVCSILPENLEKYADFDVVNQLTFCGGHLAAFLFGYFLGTYERRIPNWLLITVGLLDLAAITAFTYIFTMKSGGYNAIFQTQNRGFELLLAACIFLLAKQKLNKTSRWAAALTTPAARLCFPIYLMHNILLSAFYRLRIMPTTALLSLPLTLLTFAVCYVIIKTLSTIKPLCYLFTGISYAEACQSCNWIATYHRIKRRL